MADYIVNQVGSFKYTYSPKQKEEVEKIRNKYIPKQESKMEQLVRLDKQVEKAGQMASLVVGVIGSLVLGVGMCCTMVWNTNMMVFIAGILIGIVGLIMVGMAYPVNKKVIERERAKIADQVIELTKELLLN